MLDDRLFYCLKADGFVLEPRYLTFGNPDSMQIGYSFVKNGVEFVCRVDETDEKTVVLVFYGLKALQNTRPLAKPLSSLGLKSGFAELMWLLNYLKSKNFERIKGYIWKDEKALPQGASLERMQAFYERMGARLEKDAHQSFMVYTLRDKNDFRGIKGQSPGLSYTSLQPAKPYNEGSALGLGCHLG